MAASGTTLVAPKPKGIIDPATVATTETFVWLMMAALISSALWVNLATVLNAPVSTTSNAVVQAYMALAHSTPSVRGGQSTMTKS